MDNVSNTNPSVEWLRKRLVAHACGLLDESEQSRVIELVRDDAACRLLWEEFSSVDLDSTYDAGHISTAVLARWGRIGDRLTELERRLVEDHLERCSECREDLIVLEQGVDSLEAPVADEAEQGPSNSNVLELKTTPRKERTGRSKSSFAGWGVAAACLALLVVTNLDGRRAGEEDVVFGPAPLVIPDRSVRGDEELPSAGSRRLAVTLSRIPDGFSTADSVRISLVRDGVELVAHFGIVADLLQPRIFMVGLQPSSGESRVVLRLQSLRDREAVAWEAPLTSGTNRD